MFDQSMKNFRRNLYKLLVVFLFAATAIFVCGCNLLASEDDFGNATGGGGVGAGGSSGNDQYKFFGLSHATFSSNEIYRALAFDNGNNRIYAANENKKRVDVLDSNGRFLRSINGSDFGSGGNYKNISDVFVYGTKLFVASHQNNRVDVYNLSGSGEIFVMSLGRGGSWGDAGNHATGLLHPQSVVANDKYIFVAVYNGDIVVYENSVATAENHKKAPKFCYLKMSEGKPSNVMGNLPYLTIIDNKLYATADNFDMLYVFNISNLSNNASVMPASVVTKPGSMKMHGISQSGNVVAVSQGDNERNGRVAFYSKSDFTSLKFDNPLGIFTDIFGEKFPTVPKNVYLNGENLFITTISYSTNNENFVVSGKTFVAKWKEYESYGSGGSSQEVRIDASDLRLSRKFILQNNESYNIITNQDANNPRWFYVNDPIQVEIISETSVRVTSYCLLPVTNVKVYAELYNAPDKVIMFTIPEVEALSQAVYKLPFCIKGGGYRTDSGKLVHVPQIDAVTTGMANFSVDSNDANYKKIRNIKANWRITFGTYGLNGHENWRAITPIFCREWISAITNFAYAMSSDVTRKILSEKHYTKIYKDNNGNPIQFHKDNGTTLTRQYEFNDLFDNVFAMKEGVSKNLSLGILKGGGVIGLGGGAVLGISRWYFYEQYFNFGSAGTIMHEFAHCCGGYGHGSSLCYGEFESGMARVCNVFVRLGEMPYPDKDIVGLYKPENAQYRISRDPNGTILDSDQVNADTNRFVPRKNLTQEEKYILNNASEFSSVSNKLRTFIKNNPTLFSEAERTQYGR